MFVVAVLVAGWLFIPFGAPRISQENCDKIQIGWTPKQVEELLSEERLSKSKPGWQGAKAFWSDETGDTIMVSPTSAVIRSMCKKSPCFLHVGLKSWHYIFTLSFSTFDAFPAAVVDAAAASILNGSTRLTAPYLDGPHSANEWSARPSWERPRRRFECGARGLVRL